MVLNDNKITKTSKDITSLQSAQCIKQIKLQMSVCISAISLLHRWEVLVVQRLFSRRDVLANYIYRTFGEEWVTKIKLNPKFAVISNYNKIPCTFPILSQTISC